ncbi:mitochondrial-processing peptidase subunit alpha [Coccidioides posadasii str. Silveira]|uniref:Alpha-MPP n=1 Tax=Coccidioides posadasii (strain RMSCC 757 / Silveira) TaxID=443226 RepID=E9D201_COCPS|nr:mitochondrial-processing peptidase subunit alpha [Coccidioides posadasii str. Silveira]
MPRFAIRPGSLRPLIRPHLAQRFDPRWTKRFAQVKSTGSEAATKDPVELDQITTLPNGLRVATESLPGPFAGVGVYIDAGSRYENESLRGVSHIVDRLAFKSTKTRTGDQMLEALESLGGNIQCASSRESLMYQSASFNSAVPTTLGLLAETIREPLITDEEVQMQLAVADYEIRELWAKPEMILPELVNMAAYKDNTLGNPLLCPKERLDQIDRKTVERYRDVFFGPERMVVAFAGVPHAEAVRLTEMYFGDMKRKTAPVLEGVGSEIRVNDADEEVPTMPAFSPSSTTVAETSSSSSSSSSRTSSSASTSRSSSSGMFSKLPFLKSLSTSASARASVSPLSPDLLKPDTLNLNQVSHYTGGFLSLPPIPPPANPALPPNPPQPHRLSKPSPSSSPDIYALGHLQTLLGGGGSLLAGGPGKGIYTDSGLFGISASCHPQRLTHMIDVICGELQALTLEKGYSALQLAEVNRAKNQLRSSLLMNLESRMVELEDLGRQVQVHGRKIGAMEMCKQIEAVTVADLRRVAKDVFFSKVKNKGMGTGLPTVVLQEGELEGVKLNPMRWNDIQDRINGWYLGRR